MLPYAEAPELIQEHYPVDNVKNVPLDIISNPLPGTNVNVKISKVQAEGAAALATVSEVCCKLLILS